MAKILHLKRVKPQESKQADQIKVLSEDVEDKISAIENDYSLTPANKRWLLENLLMDMDDQLEAYKQELERAERRLEKLVKTAEKDIEAAYSEYVCAVMEMTEAVKNLTARDAKHRN